MATKKSASKKASGSEMAANKPVAEKTAANKAASKTAPANPIPAGAGSVSTTPAKGAAKKTVDVQASAAASQGHGTEKKAGRQPPSHQEISVRAYLLWEREGKRHGHQDHYWKQAEKELVG